MDELESVGSEVWQEEAEEAAEVTSDCTGVLPSKRSGGGSLIWWLVRFQELLGEGVDLVGTSDFVRQ